MDAGRRLRATLDFLLYDWLHIEQLTSRPRFAEHSRDTFDAVLQTCERIAREKFEPFNRLVDTEEPRMDGERVVLPRATHEALAAYVASGMMSASQDHEMGGLQLPFTVEAAANGFFSQASISINSALLTVGNANLLLAHGSGWQREVFARQQLAGRWAGTMCLSEPQAGSSLGDISTRASPDGPDFERDPLGPRHRLRGHKMWISSGDHELTENIIHLVLAKVPDEQGRLPAGVKGISLFIVPKHLVDGQGRLSGQRNDVALAGLNHKLGWRGTTNTLLNFGEGRYPVDGQAGAVGYRVGLPGQGLACMFHMMNEARIGIGMAASLLGLAGYHASLQYARQRPQGRHRAAGTGGPQVPIIEHADVKRMLLAQKAYGEGALALQLYCARLVDEQRTGSAQSAAQAHQLLELLTPVAKSWPSQWCLEANSLAIQVHGGYGYTRDFPVEQYWRDNRLNMIHEGTHGIQAADLLGRKVLQDGGAAMDLLGQRIAATAQAARARADLAEFAGPLEQSWQAVLAASRAAWQGGDTRRALANAVPFMQGFGHTVLAWLWLDLVAHAQASTPAQLGRLAAAQYFFRYELPQVGAWLAVVSQQDMTCADLPEDAF